MSLFDRGAWAIVDELRGCEAVVCGTPGDAAAIGTQRAREAGHGEFHMWDCVECCIENWAPVDEQGYQGESFGRFANRPHN